MSHGLIVMKFCGGVSRGSGDIIHVVVCSGILYALLLYRTMYICNSQVNHIVTTDKTTDLTVLHQCILFANQRDYSSCIVVLPLPTFVSCSFPY